MWRACGQVLCTLTLVRLTSSLLITKLRNNSMDASSLPPRYGSRWASCTCTALCSGRSKPVHESIVSPKSSDGRLLPSAHCATPTVPRTFQRCIHVCVSNHSTRQKQLAAGTAICSWLLCSSGHVADPIRSNTDSRCHSNRQLRLTLTALCRLAITSL